MERCATQGWTLMVCFNSHQTTMAINQPKNTPKNSNGIKSLTSQFPGRLGLIPGNGGCLARWNVLRDEVLLGTRHAVIVRPAVDQRQRRAKVAMPRRGVRGLPLQRGGVPGVAARWLAFEIAPDQVVQKHDLDGAHDQRRDGDTDVQ